MIMFQDLTSEAKQRAIQEVTEIRRWIYPLDKQPSVLVIEEFCRDYKICFDEDGSINWCEINGFIKTDDMQYLRKNEAGVYELIEASEVDEMFAISAPDEVYVDEYFDEDGNYNDNAIKIIKSYYSSVEEFIKNVPDMDTQEQYFVEMVYESTSSLSPLYEELLGEDAADEVLRHYVITEDDFYDKYANFGR